MEEIKTCSSAALTYFHFSIRIPRDILYNASDKHEEREYHYISEFDGWI